MRRAARRLIHSLTLVATILLASSAGRAAAQDALVLSGGGGRGIAHAGALIGIEARGWSPELVAGTSMGAVVGALYAAGYTADSIARLVRVEDWRELFTRGAWLLGSDRGARRPMVELPLGRAGPTSTIGFIDEVGINRRLVRLLFDAGVRARNDFDRLPRRFRAVSAELAEGEAVVTGSGDLARAVRASMSVPGVFAPIPDDSRLLVDGGIASHLPLEVVWRLGASRVIAVDVIRPPPRIESYDPFAIGSRAFRLVLSRSLDGARPPDYLVLPEIPQGFSAAYFPLRPGPLLRIGELAALAALPVLSDSAAPPRPPLPPPARIADLVVESTNPAFDAVVAAAFRDVAGAPYAPERVFTAVDRLYASGLFRAVWPRVEIGDDASLVVNTAAAPRTRLGLAAAYDSDIGGWAWAAARHRPRGGPLDLAIEGRIGGLESFASLDARRVSTSRPDVAVIGGAAFRDSEIRLFDDDNDIIGDRDVTRTGGWFGIEWRSLEPERFAALTLRAEYIDVERASPSEPATAGGTSFGAEDGIAWGPFLRFGETASAPPIVGEPVMVEAEARFGEIAYRRVRAAGSLDTQLGRVLLSAAAQVSFASRETPPDALVALGDQHFIPGLRWGRDRGRETVAGGVDVAYPIILDGHLRLRVRAGYTNDVINEIDEDGGWIGGLGVAGVWLTPIGGATVAAGVTDLGDWRVDVTIGAR